MAHEVTPENTPEQKPEGAARELALARLDMLGDSLSKKRKQAIDGRRTSGIEEEWREDEEAYLGIDDANRGQETGAGRYRWQKPTTLEGGPTRDTGTPGRSTIFLNITAPYVDAGSAKIQEIMLPSDDKPWGLQPTPVPELTNLIGEINELPAQTDGADILQLAKQDFERKLSQAKKQAEMAEKQVEDWLTEGQWQSELRDVIDDAGRIGVGVLKGPFPDISRATVNQPGPTGEMVSVVKEDIKPRSRRVDAWNLYPDPLCGEDVHRGAYIWERDDITLKTLRDLRNNPEFIAEQIDRVIAEGPRKAEVEDAPGRENLTDDTPYEIWYYHGCVEKEELEAASCKCDDKGYMPAAVLTMVNNRVIRATTNPLDGGDFPYDVMTIKKRKGHWAGVGWARMLRSPQRGINAAIRNMMDNAGLTAGPQIVVSDDIEPADGITALTPRKIWRAGADVTDVRQAITSINIECNQEDMMAILMFYIKMAEGVTGLPLMMQGQQGKAPDTVGGMQILNQNASAGLRRIARMFDRLIESHIGRYYKWLMEYGENPEQKGDFIIDARASSVLVEMDIQNQFIMAALPNLMMNPESGINPRKATELILRSAKLDPDLAMYDETEWQQIQRARSQVPPDPRIITAQMKSQDLEKDRQHETQENEMERKHEEALAFLENQLTAAGLDGQQIIEDSKIRAGLATNVMNIKKDYALQTREAAIKNKFGEGL